ncbi:flagellar biogenesis protein [Erythrobacter sp. 3-20A1M]|uniref:FliO/MopB family protein n=1 Tax=Erythrobacter sp. 3-20A1M TaxID=2653850 RepID=UPI001BFC8F11|nr:flagellar biosynthetic protein FliO [Erythrobacter sp. 3-20A1M]QWC57403.1 flagellar biogenesis protein [Erythrobacter sp. 3-20A1M]
MAWYVVKLILMLALLGGMIWGSLWLTKRLQGRFVPAGRTKAARLIETTMLSPGVKLAVIEFHGREILVGSSRHGLTRLAEAEARPPVEPEDA